eukprot:7426791-Pyramimonas_sp.AAC.1
MHLGHGWQKASSTSSRPAGIIGHVDIGHVARGHRCGGADGRSGSHDLLGLLGCRRGLFGVCPAFAAATSTLLNFSTCDLTVFCLSTDLTT